MDSAVYHRGCQALLYALSLLFAKALAGDLRSCIPRGVLSQLSHINQCGCDWLKQGNVYVIEAVFKAVLVLLYVSVGRWLVAAIVNFINEGVCVHLALLSLLVWVIKIHHFIEVKLFAILMLWRRQGGRRNTTTSSVWRQAGEVCIGAVSLSFTRLIMEQKVYIFLEGVGVVHEWAQLEEWLATCDRLWAEWVNWVEKDSLTISHVSRDIGRLASRDLNLAVATLNGASWLARQCANGIVKVIWLLKEV